MHRFLLRSEHMLVTRFSDSDLVTSLQQSRFTF